MLTVAHIENDFGGKFGVPRQSGLTGAVSRVVFEPEYRDPTALRGIEGFSHLWLLWLFHQAEGGGWRPTVRPPRLGGNQRMGVWATRSPFRPNSIGLSSVRLLGVEQTSDRGPTLLVQGADMVSGTPIVDIKPYLPFTDCHAEATSGFTRPQADGALAVTVPPSIAQRLTDSQLSALRQALSADPRPAYHNDPERVYVMDYAGMSVRFTVRDGVVEILGD